MTAALVFIGVCLGFVAGAVYEGCKAGGTLDLHRRLVQSMFRECVDPRSHELERILAEQRRGIS